MDRQTVVARDLAARYLRGKLTEEERDAFEEFYLDDPDTLDELELHARLPRLPRLARRARARPVPAAHSADGGAWQPGGGALVLPAATLVLGLLLGAAVDPWHEQRAGSAVLLDVDAMRGDGAPVGRVGTDGYVVIRLPVGARSAVDVEVKKDEAQVVALRGLQPDAFGDVLAALERSTLEPDLYRVQVREAGRRELIFESAFRLQR